MSFSICRLRKKITVLWTHVPRREIKERQEVTFALGNMGVRTFPCVSENHSYMLNTQVCLDLTGKLRVGLPDKTWDMN